MVADTPLEDADERAWSDIQSALRHERRRAAVELLADHEESITLVGLTNQLASRSNVSLPHLLTEFHDLHLPALQESGLVEYDDETGTIRLAPPRAVVEQALTATDTEES